MNYKVILDTDIADDIDDAFALGLLLNQANVELLGVTTVYKNVRQRSKVVKYELDSASKAEIPVYSGFDKPSCKDIIRWPYEKDNDEFGLIKIGHYDEELMGKYEADKGDAIDFMIDMARKYPHEVTLVPIGPLTNIAEFYNRDKEAFMLLKDILLMGTDTNTAHREWNIFVDPKAAKTVFSSGVPMKVIGFQETIKTVLTKEDIEVIRNFKNPLNKAIAFMMDKWILDHDNRCPILHDALTVAEFEHSFCNFDKVDVEISEDGKSFISLNPNSNILMSNGVDDRGFIKYILEKLMERE